MTSRHITWDGLALFVTEQARLAPLNNFIEHKRPLPLPIHQQTSTCSPPLHVQSSFFGTTFQFCVIHIFLILLYFPSSRPILPSKKKFTTNNLPPPRNAFDIRDITRQLRRQSSHHQPFLSRLCWPLHRICVSSAS